MMMMGGGVWHCECTGCNTVRACAGAAACGALVDLMALVDSAKQPCLQTAAVGTECGCWVTLNERRLSLWTGQLHRLQSVHSTSDAKTLHL